jgi:spermidine synthase
MTSIKHWFNPQLIKTLTSKYNSEIQLIKFMGKFRLDMGGLTQSGPIIEEIWQSSLKKLLPKNFSPGKSLILGFCTGSAARVISQRFPNCQITGIEIDPVIIDIAKKYFRVDEIKKLQIVNDDALKYINKLKKNDNFDLILIDCYIGYKIPAEFKNPKTLEKIKKHTRILLLNRLFWDKHKQKTLDFISKLNQNFITTTHRTTWNLVISLSSGSNLL